MQTENESGEHDPAAMIRQMRGPWLWTNYTVIALGLWLATAPATFGYRQAAMTWSDVGSGVLLVLLGAFSLRPTPRADFFGRWSVAVVGTWLQLAPLVLWATSAAAYANDTLVGVFAIALSILVPMMPGMAHHMAMKKPGSEVPPGWSYNPSSWPQRAPLIALGLAGWLVSRLLAAVQLGYVDAAWEPFFGAGTDRVLHSAISRAWPISDAGLGALAYTFETLMGFMGGVTRWRSMPWMVTFFGILVIPLGVTHIVLVILQPVVVGSWCTLCLLAASVMLAMIPLAVDEVVAMLQFLALARREGKPLWRTFWVGGTLAEKNADERTPHYGDPLQRFGGAMVWGFTATSTLLGSAAIGLWTMLAPAVFATTGHQAKSDVIAGALAVTVAVIAMAEVVRTLRLLNVGLGLWIAVAPWLLSGASAASRCSAAVSGLALALASVMRGRVREHYGGWDRYVV